MTRIPPTPETEVSAPTGASATGGQLEALLEPLAETMGFEVVLLEWAGAGSRHVLRIFLDRRQSLGQPPTPGGAAHDEAAPGAEPTELRVDVDDCARMSRIFSNALEAAEEEDPSIARLLGGGYNLEVSSPGLERPLARRSHFTRFTGRQAKVRTIASLQPETRQRSFSGVIEETEPDPHRPDDDRAGTVTLRDLDSGNLHRIPITAIRRANLVYEG